MPDPAHPGPGRHPRRARSRRPSGLDPRETPRRGAWPAATRCCGNMAPPRLAAGGRPRRRRRRADELGAADSRPGRDPGAPLRRLREAARRGLDALGRLAREPRPPAVHRRLHHRDHPRPARPSTPPSPRCAARSARPATPPPPSRRCSRATAPSAAVRRLDPTRKFDLADQGRRQPGSAFKPFVYLAALRDGIDPRSHVRRALAQAARPTTASRYTVNNYEGDGRGEHRRRRRPGPLRSTSCSPSSARARACETWCGPPQTRGHPRRRRPRRPQPPPSPSAASTAA